MVENSHAEQIVVDGTVTTCAQTLMEVSLPHVEVAPHPCRSNAGNVGHQPFDVGKPGVTCDYTSIIRKHLQNISKIIFLPAFLCTSLQLCRKYKIVLMIPK